MKTKVDIKSHALKNHERMKMNSNTFLTVSLTGFTIFIALVSQNQHVLNLSIGWLILGFVIYLPYLILFKGPLFTIRGGIIFYLMVVFFGVESYFMFDNLMTITCFVAFASGFSSSAFIFWQYQLRNLNLERADQSDDYNEEIPLISSIEQFFQLIISKKK